MTSPTKTLARTLRSEMTIAENALWCELQDLNRDHGTHFRRQTPIGRYIADFCEHTRKLIIEVDGYHHAEPTQAVHDEQRTEWLASQGYRVIRFTNADVSDTIEGVVIEIMSASGVLEDDCSLIVDKSPTPSALAEKAKARIDRQRMRIARRNKSYTPTPNPSPRRADARGAPRGGGLASNAKAGIGREVSAGLAPIVPSPLVGEGQGGGYGAGAGAKNTPTPNPSPQGGGELASNAKAVAGVEEKDSINPIVPSPLVGERQGGGYGAAETRNRDVSP